MENNHDILIRDTIQFWRDYIVKAEVTIDGVVQEYPIFQKNIKGNRIRFVIYVTGNQGKVTDVVVYNKNNEPVRILESKLEKGQDGLTIVLSWTLTVREEFML